MKLLLFCKKIKFYLLKSNNFLYIFFINLLVCLDLSSKAFVEHFLLEKNIIQFKITSFFNLTSVYNQGVVFGFFNNNQFVSKIINYFNIFILFYLISIFLKRERFLEKFSISLIISGGIGNLIDKFTKGAVYDFLDFFIGNNHWYVFNLADSFVCIGVLLLLLTEVKIKKE